MFFGFFVVNAFVNVPIMLQLIFFVMLLQFLSLSLSLSLSPTSSVCWYIKTIQLDEVVLVSPDGVSKKV